MTIDAAHPHDSHTCECSLLRASPPALAGRAEALRRVANELTKPGEPETK